MRRIVLGVLLMMATVGTAPAAGGADAPAAVQTAAPAPAQSRDGQNRRVRIHNQTGWAMTRFQVADAGGENWRELPLGEARLASGASVVLNVDDGSGACVVDFKARFTNRQELKRPGVNVCEIADYYYTR